MANKYEKKATVFKALCDEKRQHIIELLYDGEMCVSALTEKMGMPQSSLSYHMKILCRSGIVTGRVFGKWTYYSLSDSGIAEAKRLIIELENRGK